MKRLRLTLTTHEPLLITRLQGDANTETSIDFVAGSVLRGWFAGQYLRTNGAASASTPQFTQLFLDGTTRFLNGYPVLNEQRSTPTAMALVREKDAPWNATIVENQLTLDQDGNIRKSLGGYSVLGPNATLTEAQQRTTITVHTTRNRMLGRARKDDGAVFRYEAIAAGQTFQAEIVSENADLLQVVSALAAPTMLLGGAHSAGYGLVSAAVSAVEPIPGTVTATAKKLVIQLESDLIARNAHGLPGNIKDALATALSTTPDAFDLTQAIARTELVGGFNNTWELPVGQDWAIKRGSVFEIETAFDAAEIAAKCRNGVGERTAEGYGVVAVNPAWMTHAALTLTDADAASNETAEIQLPTLSAVEQNFINRMQRNLVAEWLDRAVVIAAQTLTKNARNRLSNSQWARLRLQIRQQQQTTDAKTLERYLEGTKQRKSADDQFRKSRISGKDPRVWMTTLLQEPQTVWQAMEADTTQLPTLAGQPIGVAQDGFAKKYALRLMDEVCRLMAKQGGAA